MIVFISRHAPTPAQQATVAERFGDLVSVEALTFRRHWVSSDTYSALLKVDPWAQQYQAVAGVFPDWALLELLRVGWSVVTFMNEPSARGRGVFICQGAFVHTLEFSEFLPCPISVEDQEDSPLPCTRWEGAGSYPNDEIDEIEARSPVRPASCMTAMSDG